MTLPGWRLKALAGAALAALLMAAPQGGARAQTLVVGQAGDTLTLELRDSGSVRYDEIRAFN